MAAYLGSTAVSRAYVGTTPVGSIYLGSTKVWSPAPPTVSDVTSAIATNVTMPTMAVGDLLLLFVFAASNTPATKPTAGGTVPDWVVINNATGSNNTSNYVSCFVATATNHTSGTWTGAAVVMAAAISGQKPGTGTTSIGGNGVQYNTSSGSIAAPAVTLSHNDGTSLLVGQFFTTASGGTWSAAPSGYTKQHDTPGCLDTKNVTTSDGSVTQTYSKSGVNIGTQIEVLAY